MGSNLQSQSQVPKGFGQPANMYSTTGQEDPFVDLFENGLSRTRGPFLTNYATTDGFLPALPKPSLNDGTSKPFSHPALNKGHCNGVWAAPSASELAICPKYSPIHRRIATFVGAGRTSTGGMRAYSLNEL